jgi:hypothetical protein
MPPINVIHRAPVTFSEPNVPAELPGVGDPLIPAKNGAGLWGLVASEAAALNQMKAAGPASTAAVVAQTDTGDPAVFGTSDAGNGIRGTSTSAQGVFGHSTNQVGVYGESDNFDGVFGFTKNQKAAGVSGHNPGGLAGFFDGNVTVTGDVTLPGVESLHGIIQQLQALAQILTYQYGSVPLNWTPPLVPVGRPQVSVNPNGAGDLGFSSFTMSGFGIQSGPIRVVFKDLNGVVIYDNTLPESAFIFQPPAPVQFSTRTGVELGKTLSTPFYYAAFSVSAGLWSASYYCGATHNSVISSTIAAVPLTGDPPGFP